MTGTDQTPDNEPHRALRHHITGAVERGEAVPIVNLAQHPDDPTLAEMLAHLESIWPPDTYEDDLAARADHYEAIYWFSSDWHGGQATNLYSACSTGPYRPGPYTARPHPDSEAGAMIAELERTYT